MSMVNEFKAFIARGNVVDLAVGVIMGAAFGAIVTALVDNVIMPPIGWILGGIDFSEFYFSIDGKSYGSLKAAKDAAAPVIAYGVFLNAVIKFIIVSFAIFLMVKGVNKMTAKMLAQKAAEPVPPTKSEILLEQIRDALKSR
jgi:large conductance mechanosensitive channel